MTPDEIRKLALYSRDDNKLEKVLRACAEVVVAAKAVTEAARSHAGDVGAHHEAWIWDKIEESYVALAKLEAIKP